MSSTAIATYNQIFAMTTNINRFISEANAAKTNIVLSLNNAINSSPHIPGIGEHVNLLA